MPNDVKTERPRSNFLMTKDMTICPELLGLQTLEMPFPQEISSQRGVMCSSNVRQSVVVKGCNPPRVMTGWEPLIGEYEFSQSTAEHESYILKIIPKYRCSGDDTFIHHSPSTLVIYQDLVTHKLNYLEISDYTELTDTFGYTNVKINQHMLQEGGVVPAGTKFTTSPNHKGEFYCKGLNANFINITYHKINEDAFIVSDRFAKNGTHEAIDTIDLEYSPEDIPLNLFGDELVYKVIPDIGEQCTSKGLCTATRKLDDTTFITDILPSELQKVNYLHDLPVYAFSNATIVDVEVFINRNNFNNSLSKDPSLSKTYGQLIRYADQYVAYCREVTETINSLRREGYELSRDINALLRQYAGIVASTRPRRDGTAPLINYKTPIEFIRMRITYKYDRQIAPGSKLTGRDGMKGVVADIWPLEDMPHDEYGNYADVMIPYVSAPQRLSLSQFDEQFLTSLGRIIQSKACHLDDQAAYQFILKVVNDIRPVMRELIEQQCPTLAEQTEFVNTVRTEGMYWIIAPYSTYITPEKCLEIAKKYGYKESKITFNNTLSNGQKVPVTLDEPGCIGSKYIMILGKLPEKMCSAVNSAYLSQFGLPLKPSNYNIKLQNPINITPIRYGESEVMLDGGMLGMEPMARTLSLYSNSFDGGQVLTNTLLTSPEPTQIQRVNVSTKELTERNTVIKLFKHQCGLVGYDFTPEVKLSEEEKRQYSLLDQREGGE